MQIKAKFTVGYAKKKTCTRTHVIITLNNQRLWPAIPVLITGTIYSNYCTQKQHQSQYQSISTATSAKHWTYMRVTRSSSRTERNHGGCTLKQQSPNTGTVGYIQYIRTRTLNLLWVQVVCPLQSFPGQSHFSGKSSKSCLFPLKLVSRGSFPGWIRSASGQCRKLHWCFEKVAFERGK